MLSREQVEHIADNIGAIPPLRPDIQQWLDTDDALRAECERLKENLEEAMLRLNEALGCLGYPVPADTPTGNVQCGLCGAREIQVDTLTAENERLKAEMGYHEAKEVIEQLRAENERLRQEQAERDQWKTNAKFGNDIIAQCKQQLATMTEERDEWKANAAFHLQGVDTLSAQLAATTEHPETQRTETYQAVAREHEAKRLLAAMTAERNEWKTACALSEARVKELEARR